MNVKSKLQVSQMFRIRPDSDNKVAIEVASNQKIKRVCNQYENK